MRLAPLVLLVVGTLVSLPALAQDDAPVRVGLQDDAGNALDLDRADAGGFVIVGREHLPDFTVLIDRENLSKAYDLELKERFLTRIIEAVAREPF
jgi:hypothetical protein